MYKIFKFLLIAYIIFHIIATWIAYYKYSLNINFDKIIVMELSPHLSTSDDVQLGLLPKYLIYDVKKNLFFIIYSLTN